MSDKMQLIYVSGPYTHGDVAWNVHNAVKIGLEIIALGHAPYIPHLSHFIHYMTPQPYETWMKVDLRTLRSCDALFRVHGYSPGAEREVAAAKYIKLPVFGDLKELREWLTTTK